MASVFSRFVSYRKHLKNISKKFKQKDNNTQADLISEIEIAWEQLNHETIDN